MHAIPLIVLGGSDRRAGRLPAGSGDRHSLSGYKGLALEVAGRPLALEVIERMAAPGVFSPIWLVGPGELYAPLLESSPVDVRLVDHDGSFGDNIHAAVDLARAELAPEYLAFTTCDILPDPDELAVAVADLRRHLPLDFWMPQVPISQHDERLGSSAWKPSYAMRPPGAPEAVQTLPGHLVIGAVESIRLDFVYRLFDLFYRTRNSPVARRRYDVLRGMLWHLLREDFRRLSSGRLPYALLTVLAAGLKFAAVLMRGAATTRDLEDQVRKVCMTREHRRLHPTRRGRIAVLDVLSLARDIDTEEEARELTDAVGREAAG